MSRFYLYAHVSIVTSSTRDDKEVIIHKQSVWLSYWSTLRRSIQSNPLSNGMFVNVDSKYDNTSIMISLLFNEDAL